MTTRGKKPSALIGDNVTLPVPDVDRAPTDPRNLICVLVGIKDESYKLGTTSGILNHWYTKTEFTICKTKFIALESVNKEKNISLRQAAGKESLVGGQGMQKCNCKKDPCENNKCNCKKNGVICNSKCHPGI